METELEKPNKKLIFMERQNQQYEITQFDLTEERHLTIEAGKALAAMEAKREIIRKLFESGASVEPGLRSVQLIPVAPKPYSVTPQPYKKLVIK